MNDQGAHQTKALRPAWPLSIIDYTLTNALGVGRAATTAGVLNHQSGLRPIEREGVDFQTAIGRVDAIEHHALPKAFSVYEGRNNRLAHLALLQDGFMDRVIQLRESLGASRIGVIIGTSTSGILETEIAYTRRDAASGALPSDFHYQETQNTFAPADFVSQVLRLEGPALTMSTACSSSAKVFSTASRWLQHHLCDAVVVGGVDSLCLTTLFGFQSLELLAQQAACPCDVNRNGISIGEGAGFALLSQSPLAQGRLMVMGAGESSDAHHMSSPHPQGLGAAMAMRACLESARIGPGDVDFVMLHGTATKTNDLAEDQAICEVLGQGKPCASIKGHFGHTLGAAGIMNTLTACLGLEGGWTPGTLHTREIDPAIKSQVELRPTRDRPVKTILSNAFGFGGSNACLLIGRYDAA